VLCGRESELGFLTGLVDGVRDRGAAVLVPRRARNSGSPPLLAAGSRAGDATRGCRCCPPVGGSVGKRASRSAACISCCARSSIWPKGSPARQRAALLAVFGMSDEAAPRALPDRTRSARVDRRDGCELAGLVDRRGRPVARRGPSCARPGFRRPPVGGGAGRHVHRPSATDTRLRSTTRSCPSWRLQGTRPDPRPRRSWTGTAGRVSSPSAASRVSRGGGRAIRSGWSSCPPALQLEELGQAAY